MASLRKMLPSWAGGTENPKKTTDTPSMDETANENEKPDSSQVENDFIQDLIRTYSNWRQKGSTETTQEEGQVDRWLETAKRGIPSVKDRVQNLKQLLETIQNQKTPSVEQITKLIMLDSLLQTSGRLQSWLRSNIQDNLSSLTDSRRNRMAATFTLGSHFVAHKLTVSRLRGRPTTPQKDPKRPVLLIPGVGGCKLMGRSFLNNPIHYPELVQLASSPGDVPLWFRYRNRLWQEYMTIRYCICC